MNKTEIAQYLVNLHTLLSAQSSGVNHPSTALAAEYEKQWGELKQAINKESEDEVRRGLRTSGNAVVDPAGGGRSGSRDDVPLERRYERAKGD